MKHKTALICLNGDLASAVDIVDFSSYDYVLAVDGALDMLMEMSIKPDTVIGDLDSVSSANLDKAEAQGITVVRVEEQETTDFEKALQHVDERGYGKVDIVGYRGIRLDHELATLEAAALYASHIGIRFLDSYAEGFVLSGLGEKSIRGKKDHVCSVLPIHPSEGVSLTGFRWPLKDTRMGGGFPNSCSNEIAADRASVTLKQGTILIYLHRTRKYG